MVRDRSSSYRQADSSKVRARVFNSMLHTTPGPAEDNLRNYLGTGSDSVQERSRVLLEDSAAMTLLWNRNSEVMDKGNRNAHTLLPRDRYESCLSEDWKDVDTRAGIATLLRFAFGS